MEWKDKKDSPAVAMKHYCIRIKNEDTGKHGLDQYTYDNCFRDEHGWTSYYIFDFDWLDESETTPAQSGEELSEMAKILQELLYLKSIKDIPEYKEDYELRKPLAWAEAKRIIGNYNSNKK